jgi:hypothetical protein
MLYRLRSSPHSSPTRPPARADSPLRSQRPAARARAQRSSVRPSPAPTCAPAAHRRDLTAWVMTAVHASVGALQCCAGARRTMVGERWWWCEDADAGRRVARCCSRRAAATRSIPRHQRSAPPQPRTPARLRSAALASAPLQRLNVRIEQWMQRAAPAAASVEQQGPCPTLGGRRIARAAPYLAAPDAISGTAQPHAVWTGSREMILLRNRVVTSKRGTVVRVCRSGIGARRCRQDVSDRWAA